MIVNTNSVVGYRPTALPEDTQYWSILSQYEIYSARIAQALVWIPVVLFLGLAFMDISLFNVILVGTGIVGVLTCAWWMMSTLAKAELTGTLYNDYRQIVRDHIVGTIEIYAILLAVFPLLAMFVFNLEL
ncbi:MAG: hypothetical protein OER96_13410 [Gammaproteobacteria bacterium]|nr:hypothetical protein [Gammaproteobacteria bacterium]